MSLLRPASIKAAVLTRSLLQWPANAQVRSIKRWVAPTLRELRKRAEKLGPQKPEPRSAFIEWNYHAELFAFSKRLHEEFDLSLLQTAFTQRSYVAREEERQRALGVEEIDIKMSDNTQLAERGERLAKEYVDGYISYSLPKVPAEGRIAFVTYLLSQDTLAHVAEHLGMKELLLNDEYPPSRQSMAQSLLAVVGALEESSGPERASLFVRDFICTQLNQRDLLELWDIANPEEMLRNICQERKLAEPEPRLIGDCGKNTVLAAYQVGLYTNKQLIGKGFGEDIPTAIRTASIDALQSFFGIHDNMRPFDFKVQAVPRNSQLT